MIIDFKDSNEYKNIEKILKGSNKSINLFFIQRIKQRDNKYSYKVFQIMKNNNINDFFIKSISTQLEDKKDFSLKEYAVIDDDLDNLRVLFKDS